MKRHAGKMKNYDAKEILEKLKELEPIKKKEEKVEKSGLFPDEKPVAKP
jgi:hypothetical protein